MKRFSSSKAAFSAVVCAVAILASGVPGYASSSLSELERDSIFWEESEQSSTQPTTGDADSDNVDASTETESETGSETETDTADADEAEEGRVVFFLYHNIRENDTLEEGDIQEWCTTEEKLKSDILTLKELGYESLNCKRYYDGDYDKSKNYFVITFDDGYLSNYTILPRVLEETDAYADVFMCTAMTNLSNHFSYSEAKRMEATGRIKLYSHYNKHEYLDELAANVLRHGLKLTFGYLDDRLGERDWFFAYPHSSYSLDTITTLYDFGVKLQFVQVGLPWYYDIAAEDYGIVLRVNVAYESDIEEELSEYYRLMGWEYTSARSDDESDAPTEADTETEEVDEGDEGSKVMNGSSDASATDGEQGVNIADKADSTEGVNVGDIGEEDVGLSDNVASDVGLSDNGLSDNGSSEGINIGDVDLTDNGLTEGVNIEGEKEASAGMNINA